MADPDDDALTEEEFEPIHVELDWYDGPRGGVADINGAPHYFRAVNDYARPGEPDDEYFVWPAAKPRWPGNGSSGPSSSSGTHATRPAPPHLPATPGTAASTIAMTN